MTGPLSIGIGCRRACPAETIVALVERAAAGLDREGARLYTLARKRDDPALHRAAALLGHPVQFLAPDRLEAALPGVTIHSPRVAAAVGVASVAEAAALAGAGVGARLVVPRMAEGGATCAVAVGPNQL